MAYHQMKDYPMVVVVGIDEQSFFEPFVQRQFGTYWRIGIISVIFILFTFLLVGTLSRNRLLMQEQIELKAGQDKELTTAGKIQSSLIPGNADWPDASVATLYLPAAKTSGDFLGYQRVGSDHLRGFILDTKGHGLTASMYTSAFYVMLNEILRDATTLNPSILEQVNEKALDYFDADTFAAIILFDFDFSVQEYSVVSGGINKFLTSCEPCGYASLPGSFVGISDATEFTMIQRGFKASDTFIFASDGLLDIAPESKYVEWMKSPGGTDDMRQWAASAIRRDDIAAISVRIK
jgi:serine phosphatase RsbU (regulator of sigma subunit)